MSDRASTRLPPGRRREQLVRMGVELLGTRPADQVSIGDIARAAGISKGLLYHYFPAKSDFVVAVVVASRDELDRRMAAAATPGLAPVDWLDATLEAFLDHAEERASGYLGLAQAHGGEDAALRAVLVEGRRRRVAALTGFAARLAGVERAAVEGPVLAASLEAWLAGTEALVVSWLEAGDLTREEVRGLLRHGLLAALEGAGSAGGPGAPAALAAAAREALALPAGVR